MTSKPLPPCAICGTPLLPRRGKVYCSRSCALKATRAKQTPEQRTAMGKAANKKRLAFAWWATFLKRVRVLGETEERRLYLAYQWGRSARRSELYRKQKKDYAATKGSNVEDASGGSGQNISHAESHDEAAHGSISRARAGAS